ncbi:BT4734/BF3469 family protein [Cytophagaceae bacterium YF14B1]|uniref:BT4734/BF3469 family protein n=1 Tax=Xanthocytophaga flava TaxID=3048013 RepID=A0AAE3QNE3_9BACT|nr:PriCT-2 domain-containing protein [Xanthocytophaga flavus]MDJ1481881.1 BT4734/BF3469 family protein [Xanthocytophaga flavus]
MNLNVQISFLPNTTAMLPTTVSLYKAVLAWDIRRFTERDRIRAAKSEEDQKILKMYHTACMTVAGIVGWKEISIDEKGKAKYEKYMKTYSGFTQIDIDHLSDYGFYPAQVRDELAKLFFVVYAGISTRGDGVWLLIYLDCYDHESYVAQWTAAQEFVYSLLDKASGQEIKRDSKGKNPTDFRFCIPDEEGKFNPNAKPFGVKKEKKSTYVSKPASTSNDRLVQLLELITDKRIDLTSSYEDWRNLGFSLAATMGESGREWFHALSQFYPDYDRLQTDHQYNESLKRNGYGFTEDFIFALARDHGILLKEKLDNYHKSDSNRKHVPAKISNPISDFESERPWDGVLEFPSGKKLEFRVRDKPFDCPSTEGLPDYPAEWDLPTTHETKLLQAS